MFESISVWAVERGVRVVDIVIYISDFLREEHTPGIVAGLLVLSLIVIVIPYTIVIVRRYGALKKLEEIVSPYANPAAFSDSLTEVKSKINDLPTSKSTSSVRDAWNEYSETLVHTIENGESIIRNSVRPSLFFNAQDLHFAPGWGKIVPGLFVTVGLFLTFLGLISALHAMNSTEGVSEEAMTNLLTVASAKFIMSLTGLLCSILFTVWLRWATSLIENVIHKVNTVLEQKLSFISLEVLAVEQVEATREQKEHFRKIGMELVEELGRPLREELPLTISTSIGDAMAPLVENLKRAGTDSVEEMVDGLSSQLSSNLESSLKSASEQLGMAAGQIGSLVEKMEGSSNRMGSEMEGASQNLTVAIKELCDTMATGANETTGAFSVGVENILTTMKSTLDGIKQNTAEGAKAMSQAADGICSAADRFSEEVSNATREGVSAAKETLDSTGNQVAIDINEAGRQVSSAIHGSGKAIAEITGEVAERAGQDLIQPMEGIAQNLDSLVEALAEGVSNMRMASGNLKEGANATSDASSNFQGASTALIKASDEVKPVVERLSASTLDLASSTRQVADVSRTNMASANRVLETAETALEGERQSILNTLEGLKQILEVTRDQGNRIDNIDEKLGGAFEKYRTEVKSAVDMLFGHVGDMQNELEPTLDRMKEIVESVEKFVPEQLQRGTR